jgi:UDP-N-acetylmuramoyl-tripeptide--D-alanyl-D-alanine ligase
MPLRPAQLVELWGPPVGPAPAEATLQEPFAAIRTDSRQPQAGALFVPLVGERFDGHAYLAAVLEGGARGALFDPRRCPPARQEALRALAAGRGALLWSVPDTLLAYQQLATLWRRQLAAAVVAVTGSAGKTTTRELIRAVLQPLGPVLASSGNENNDVGVPLTLLRADAAHRAVVVEMGMRGLGEIERLSRTAEPDIAVITNIGTAHIGRLGSREAIATAKCEIMAALRPDGLLVIPAGDPLLEAALARVWPGRLCRVALADDRLDPALPAADLVGACDNAAGLLHLEGLSLTLPLEGRHHARNLLLALAVARELGVPLAELEPLEVSLPGGRSRRLRIGGVTLLDETYNASPEAVLASLELLNSQGGRRFAVLGTMLELGARSQELHRSVAERARQLGLDGLVVVDDGAEGRLMEQAAAGLPRLARVASPEAAAAVLADWLEPGDVVLLKGSRGVALERAIAVLQSRLSPAAAASSP